MEPFKVHNKLIGRMADGSRVFVTAEYEKISREVTSTDHDTITDGKSFSLVGEVIGYRCRNPYSVGQIRDDLLMITQPAEGLEIEDIRELARIWRNCHLNDMNALCAHQHPVYKEEYGQKVLDWQKVAPCPETGYKAGSAWLYREVPEEILKRVREILS